MNKIKEFLQNKWTQRVAWGTWAVSTTVLIASGASAETVSSGVVIVAAAVTAVAGVIAFIGNQIKK